MYSRLRASRTGSLRVAQRLPSPLSNTASSVANRLSAGIQYLLPKRALTKMAGRMANLRGGRLTRSLVRRFVDHYSVNLNEARKFEVASYPTFNDFFSRALRHGARPIAPTEYVCPVDGVVSQFGTIDDSRLVQAKGHRYTTTALLAGDAKLANTFQQGSYATLYLSPRDYHRVHIPCDGRLTRMIYVPGSLFSVNPQTANVITNLFTRNERVICIFDTTHGPMAVVLVGATIVGSVATVWHGIVRPKRGRQIKEWTYQGAARPFRKGDEIGRFLLGSTVVLLFARPIVDFNTLWKPQKKVMLGEAMAGFPCANEREAAAS